MMVDEYEIMGNEDAKLKELTKDKANQYLTLIRAFTEKVVGQCSTMDPNTGRRQIDPQDRKFEIMISQEKDRFYLETGFHPEQISKFIKMQQEAENPSPEERKIMLEKIRAKFLEQTQESTAETPKKDDGKKAVTSATKEDDDWEDEDAEEKKPKGAKTVTLE